MELWLKSSKENGFWQRVEFDFQMTVYSSISYFNTIGEDLKMVKIAIETNSITEREVSLLRKIGRKANEYNNLFCGIKMSQTVKVLVNTHFSTD